MISFVFDPCFSTLCSLVSQIPGLHFPVQAFGTFSSPAFSVDAALALRHLSTTAQISLVQAISSHFGLIQSAETEQAHCGYHT